jgi:hypothetical protein
MKTHNLKIWPEFFKAILAEIKYSEIRKNDRGFSVGDNIKLREWCNGQYTGRSVLVTITHIQEGFGLEPDYVCLSIKRTKSGYGRYYDC